MSSATVMISTLGGGEKKEEKWLSNYRKQVRVTKIYSDHQSWRMSKMTLTVNKNAEKTT